MESISSREQFWRGHFAAQKTSDLTIKAYCQQHGLKMPTYYVWRKRLGLSTRSSTSRLASSDVGPCFVSVPLPGGTSLGDVVEIVLPGGAMIRVSAGCHEQQLAMVWRVVSGATEASPC